MTPAELLEEVKHRFPVLLHNEEPKLAALLRQALGQYQEKAGCVEKVKIRTLSDIDGQAAFAIPPHFLAVQQLKDAAGNYIRHDTDKGAGLITIHQNDAGAALPLELRYFINLRKVPHGAFELPDTILSLLMDYLEALIKIPNTERIRAARIAGGMDASDLASDGELDARKEQLELEMQSNRVITPMITIM